MGSIFYFMERFLYKSKKAVAEQEKVDDQVIWKKVIDAQKSGQKTVTLTGTEAERFKVMLEQVKAKQLVDEQQRAMMEESRGA